VRRRIIAAAVGVVLLVGGTAARASWFAPVGSGNGASAAAAVNGGNAPTVNASGSSVTVSWSASTLSGGTAVAGYAVKRYSSTNVLQTIGAGCASTIVVLTCTETSVPNGTWKYGVTPVKATWTGAESSKTSVVVGAVADTTAPTATITFPVSGGSYTSAAYGAGCSTANSICGTAADATGVQTVRLSVLQATSNKYWDGSAFTSTAEAFVPNTATLTSPNATSTTWRLGLSLPTDSLYTVHVQAVDTLANAQTGTTYAATATFNIDNVVPTAPVFTFPVASAAYNALGWTAGCGTASTDDMCGTASDPTPSGGIQKTQVSIKNAANNYWNGTAFSGSTQSFVDATGTTSWTLAFARPADGTYTLQAQTIDLAGNASTLSTAQTFTIDATIPTVTPTFPAASGGSYTSATWTSGCASTICGTAADGGSGVQSVKVTVRQGSGNYWNGTGFTSSTAVLLTATGTTSWSLAFPVGNFPATGSYTVTAIATDALGNTSTVDSRTFTYTVLAVTAVTSTNIGGGTAGKADIGDTFSVTFNTALNPATVASSVQTMTLCARNACTPNENAGTTKITLGGLSASTGFTVATNYATDNKTVTTSGSLTLSADQKTVTYTITSISGASDLVAGAAKTFTFIADPVFNNGAAIAAFSVPSTQLF
jgi:hypothetical protein